MNLSALNGQIKTPLFSGLPAERCVNSSEVIMNTTDVVVKRQDEIRIYENEAGEIVVFQERQLDYDQVVIFPVESAEIVAQAIIDIHRSIMEKK